MEDPYPVENIDRLSVLMFQTSNNSQLLRRVLWINAELTTVWSLKHKNTQSLYIFNRVRVLHLDRLKEGTWLHSFGCCNLKIVDDVRRSNTLCANIRDTPLSRSLVFRWAHNVPKPKFEICKYRKVVELRRDARQYAICWLKKGLSWRISTLDIFLGIKLFCFSS